MNAYLYLSLSLSLSLSLYIYICFSNMKRHSDEIQVVRYQAFHRK